MEQITGTVSHERSGMLYVVECPQEPRFPRVLLDARQMSHARPGDNVVLYRHPSGTRNEWYVLHVLP